MQLAGSIKQNQDRDVLIEVCNLKKYFPITKGLIRSKLVAEVKAVDNVSFIIRRGETLGLVGESGCGKTTVGRCILQLERPSSGEVFFEGTDLCGLKKEKMRSMRRRMQMIFQDPFGALNPRMSVGNIIGEPLRIHGLAKGKERRDRVAELLNIVGLNPRMAERYPHEFSGGQRQRIGIAKGLTLQPSLIICDEPVSALDVSIQAQIINLLEDLQDQFNLTYLFIAHDLAVVRHISDWVAVMYLGVIVEIASRDEIYKNPLHPYTLALINAVPIPDPLVEANRSHILLKGEIPSPANPPAGCRFHTRCREARFPQCREETPPIKKIEGGEHWVACHLR